MARGERVANAARGALGKDLGWLGINGVRPEEAAGERRQAGDTSQSPREKGAGGRVAQLLKKFIKMSSSTERQSQKWGGGVRRGSGRGPGHGSHVANSRGRKAPHTHTRTRQLQRGPETNGKGTKPNRAPLNQARSGTVAPRPPCPPHPTPFRLRGRPEMLGQGNEGGC